MDSQHQDLWPVLVKFIGDYGLPTFLVIYLLNTFQRKIDKLISLVDRLTGIILVMSKTDRSDIDVGDH